MFLMLVFSVMCVYFYVLLLA